MKLNDKWSIVPGPFGHDFCVLETKEGFNRKTNEPTTSEHKTYHPNAKTAIDSIIRRESVSLVELDSVKDFMENLDSFCVELSEKLSKCSIKED